MKEMSFKTTDRNECAWISYDLFDVDTTGANDGTHCSTWHTDLADLNRLARRQTTLRHRAWRTRISTLQKHKHTVTIPHMMISLSEWVSSVLRPRQHSIGYIGDGFYRSKDPTNSIKWSHWTNHSQLPHSQAIYTHTTQNNTMQLKLKSG